MSFFHEQFPILFSGFVALGIAYAHCAGNKKCETVIKITAGIGVAFLIGALISPS